MARTNPHTPRVGAIVAPIEGTKIWSGTSLTFAFATNADAAETTGNLEAGFSGTFNAIDTETNYRNAILAAFAAYSRVTNLTFAAAANFGSADIKIAGIDGYSASGTGLNGSMDFPGTNLKPGSSVDYESYLFLNTTAAGLQQGTETGGSNALLRVALHELGHGLGLGHPHDTGNGTTQVGSSGEIDAPENVLDNERYTVMSYERGGLNVRFERSFGHAASLSALDIAAIQAMYGANTNTNRGNTSYTLTDRNSATLDIDGNDGTVRIGRAFFCAWDTGGEDEIVYSGSKRVVLNLNDATLSTTDDAQTREWIEEVKRAAHYSELPNEFQLDIEDANYHAGGFFSRIFENAGEFDLGGYSIANGVSIENATGSNGNDFLIGNELSNRLRGNGGEDFLHGGSNNDDLQGGAANDQLVGGRGNDSLDGGEGDDLAIYSGNCSEYDITRDASGAITIAHVRGDAGDGTDTLRNIENARFKDGTSDLTSADLGCPPIDFVFLVDLSGSFSDDLANFVASARSIANSVRSREPDSRFAVASFIDRPVPPYGAAGDYLYNPDLPLTESISSFESALAGLSTRNGGDTPESQYVGLWRAANGIGLNLRENSRKIILIATDAPPHSAADYGLNETTIRNFLETEGITVTPTSEDTSATSTAPAPDRTIESADEPVGQIPGPGDTGNGLTPALPDDGTEPLLAELDDTLAVAGATPIFAVTADQRSTYEAIETELDRGSTVTLDSDSENIADAVRLALAEITGEVTEVGTDGDDTLLGTEGQDVIFGGAGNDRIEGRGADDTLDGGSGSDTVLGGAGSDAIFGGTGSDTLSGDDGNDQIEPGADTDTIALGLGNDIVRGTVNELNDDTIQDFAGSDEIVISGEAFTTVEVTASAGNSILTFGSDLSLTLTGSFTVADFAVSASGEAGDVTTRISFAPANATELFTINFNRGRRGIRLTGDAGDDVLQGTTRNDVLRGLDGNDRLIGKAGQDRLIGGKDDDRLLGGGGSDRLFGENGNDRLLGGGGSDWLRGGKGRDQLRGNGGNDILDGGTQRDTLAGGGGRDLFVFTSLVGKRDLITDFNASQDFIDLRSIFALPEFAGASFIGRFNQFIQLNQVGANTELLIDRDGSGSGANFQTLATLQNVTATDVSIRNFALA